MEKEFLLQFFKYDHLPEHLQQISKPFGDLAKQLMETLPRNPERTTALRKLLEAKDCAVRANLCEKPSNEHVKIINFESNTSYEITFPSLNVLKKNKDFEDIDCGIVYMKTQDIHMSHLDKTFQVKTNGYGNEIMIDDFTYLKEVLNYVDARKL